MSRKDTYFVGKFKAENNAKDGFDLVDCRNPREHMIIEISPPNPLPGETQEMSITMANTIFGALSKARPINWGRLIQKLVEKSIPHIGKKPSPLSLYILHLYQQNLCVN